MNIYVHSTKNVTSSLEAGLQNMYTILQKLALFWAWCLVTHFLNSWKRTETRCICSTSASVQSKQKLVQSGTAV